MGKHKKELVPSSRDLRIEDPSVVRLDDYRPKPPSKATNAKMRIAESLIAGREHAKAINAIPGLPSLKKPTREVIEEMNLWPGIAEALSRDTREELLSRAVEDPEMRDVWHQEALEQLDAIKIGVDCGEA